jgi:hypothetical protein
MNKLSTTPQVNIPQETREQIMEAANDYAAAAPTQNVAAPKYDFPTEILNLPSKGLLYPASSPLSKGFVEIKYMTAKEEDILSTQTYINKGIVLNKLCESMIVTPGVKYDDLLIGDKNAVLFAARQYGYGPEYQTKVTTEDGRDIDFTVDLSKLEYNELDESLVTPNVNKFSFKLPKAGNVIEFKLLTVGEQEDIETQSKNLKKYGAKFASNALTSRFRKMILSVDGSQDEKIINRIAENMLAIDSRAFREYIVQIQPDVKLDVEVEDPDTGEFFRSKFAIGLDLFYPDYKG